MSVQGYRRCRHCHEYFLPDPRNAWHQHYCGRNDCRKASKAASQNNWLKKNPDYFRGPVHRLRCAQWRLLHPDYGVNRRRRSISPSPADSAKELLPPLFPLNQLLDLNTACREDPKTIAIQDFLRSEQFILVGFASLMIKGVNKELIVPMLQRCYQLGKDLCGTVPGLET